MSLRNRIGLYGCYFLGIAGIGFTLPYLPLYLGQQGLSDRAIGLISTLAALAGLAQFPVGLWSDRLGRRKPFLVGALAILAVATWLISRSQPPLVLGILVVLFAENGLCRAIVESLTGAAVAALARPDEVGAALGALRFWKPIGIILVALAGSYLVERGGVGSILPKLAVVQGLAVAAALMIQEDEAYRTGGPARPECGLGLSRDRRSPGFGLRDRALGAFLVAMVVFHVANAPAGVYLGLFLKRSMHAPERYLSYAFIVSMIAWMLVVWPAGALADRFGRRPLLLFGWATMAARLALVALAKSPIQVVAIQALDGLANGLFAVVAAAWVTDRLADPRRAGEAQVLVGTSLVLGSAIGPALAGLLVNPLGYRGLFGLLAGLGLVATGLVAALVPETVPSRRAAAEEGPWGTVSDLSTTA
jgi:MFS family permease